MMYASVAGSTKEDAICTRYTRSNPSVCLGYGSKFLRLFLLPLTSSPSPPRRWQGGHVSSEVSGMHRSASVRNTPINHHACLGRVCRCLVRSQKISRLLALITSTLCINQRDTPRTCASTLPYIAPLPVLPDVANPPSLPSVPQSREASGVCNETEILHPRLQHY